MTAVLTGVALAVCWLYASRLIYGRLRQTGIDNLASSQADRPVALWDSCYRTGAVGKALFLGFIWPLTLAVAAVLYAITAQPPQSRHELEAAKAQMARRLADLEHELGMKGGGGS